MRDLYALETPESVVAVGVEVPGAGMLTLTVQRGDHGPVVRIDNSALSGSAEVYLDGAPALQTAAGWLGKTA